MVQDVSIGAGITHIPLHPLRTVGNWNLQFTTGRLLACSPNMLTVVLICIVFSEHHSSFARLCCGQGYVHGKASHMEQFNGSGISMQFATDGAWLDKEPVTVGVFTIVLRSSPITTWR